MSQRIRVDLQTGAISVALDALDTTITFGQVPDFPTLGPDEFVAITLVDFADVSLSEIVHLTAYTAGDFTGTIARAQEGPAPARVWPAGTTWDNAPTATELDDLAAADAANAAAIAAEAITRAAADTTLQTNIDSEATTRGNADTTLQNNINALAASAVLDGDAAGGVLSGTYPNPGFAVDMATQAELDALAAAAVLDGDAAGGDLTGTYPNPVIAALAVTDAKVAAANKDGTAVTPSMRTLGTGAQQAAAGDAVVLKAILTAKGSIYAASGAAEPEEVPVGPDYYPLVGDSSAAPGVAWLLPFLTSMGFGGLAMGSGLYYSDMSPGSTLTLAAGTVYYTPVFFGRECVLDRSAINLSASGGASSTIRLGLYTPDPVSGLPGSLLADFGTVSGNGTGHRAVTISTAARAGLHWKATVAQGSGSPTVRASAVVQHGALTGAGVTSNFDAGNNVYGFTQTGVTGALPATPTLSSVVLTVYPTGLWRAA